MRLRQQRFGSKRGAALIEYALLVAGVSLVTAAAVAVFGHKTNDLMAATAAILPGAHDDDNGAIFSGKLIETSGADAGPIAIDVTGVLANSETGRLGNNLFGPGGGELLEDLVLE